MVSVRDIQFDDKGSVEYAVFDGVDVRSEGLVDQFVSKFQQVNLDFEHRFNDKFSINARAGRSISRWDGPMRLQTFLDAIDVDNFTLDFRGGRETPLIGFGDLDLSDPNSFSYAPAAGGCHGAGRLLDAGQAIREHHRHQHLRAVRRLADDGDVRPEGRRAISRERFQHPRLEPRARASRRLRRCRPA